MHGIFLTIFAITSFAYWIILILGLVNAISDCGISIVEINK